MRRRGLAKPRARTALGAGLIVALALAGVARAALAPWYVWVSKADGSRYCAQISPGEGWTRLRGPFRDPHCERPGRPD